ncbi:Crp/Fnr family transcriptional regulator [Paraburkholderia sp. BL25I1N1]|uniref:Crp/Fnr family transcriptional regulator n=1 Tax=Paraburkholderia sp. BL25I1N1 TaxID=1938804 RepID=UPI000D07E78F|nr:Crp/Fnr family transcriptional regulator [Paraburkholderia sp. BL25I1N1]PRY04729.1 cyclic nucleotide-binding protein [Paraburkholderia sp. BL25I1N1]
MNSHVQSYRPQLATTPWFKDLPIELQDYLVAQSDLLRLKKGQQLYRRGDKSFGLYAVLDGALSIGTVGADGKEALLAVLGPTAWIGEISMFDGLPRPHDASAISDTLVLHVPGAPLESLLKANPAYWRNFGLLMAQKIRISFENNEAMTLLPAAQRLASRLLLIAGGYGGINAERSRIKLSQDTLASMVSLTRQTTNQLLKNLESQGIVDLKFGEIVILDFDRLHAASIETPGP